MRKAITLLSIEHILASVDETEPHATIRRHVEEDTPKVYPCADGKTMPQGKECPTVVDDFKAVQQVLSAEGG